MGETMRFYTCENYVNVGVVCEVTTQDGSERPCGCPYGMLSNFKVAYKEECE